jgi:hypothetical protein
MDDKIVVAVAGRRIDAPGAAARFPLENVALVRDRLRDLFLAKNAGTLVCSGACGTDLVALETARTLRMDRRIVLPFAAALFRDTSVTDRPGDWGPSFDARIDEVTTAGNLVVLGGSPDEPGIYLKANDTILDEALALAGDPSRAAAVIVWEGAPRGEDDVTDAFGKDARRRGLSVFEVSTR